MEPTEILPLLIPVEVRTLVPTRIALSNKVFRDSPETLTEERAQELLAERRLQGPAKKKKGR